MTSCPSAACGDIYSVGDSFTVNTGPNLGCLSQTLPLYGHVWWLDRSVFMGRRMESFKYDIHPRSFTVKTRTKKTQLEGTLSVVLLRSPVIKQLLYCGRSANSTTRKSWRTCRLTRHATWRRWRPSSSRHRRRRGRGWVSWSRPSSPSTDTWMSPTTRGERFHCVFLRIMFSKFRHDSLDEDEK